MVPSRANWTLKRHRKVNDEDLLEFHYRLRLIQGLHQEACRRGIYKTTGSVRRLELRGDLRTSVVDVLFLAEILPIPSAETSPRQLEANIKSALRKCKCPVVKKFSCQAVYCIMRIAFEDAQ